MPDCSPWGHWGVTQPYLGKKDINEMMVSHLDYLADATPAQVRDSPDRLLKPAIGCWLSWYQQHNATSTVSLWHFSNSFPDLEGAFRLNLDTQQF